MDKEEANLLAILESAIDEGIYSGRAKDFDPVKHLEFLKATRNE